MRAVICQLVAAFAATGCGANLGTPDSGGPLEIPMQIVVGDGFVQIYMEGADLGGCSCQAVAFPAAGACSFLTDAGPCDSNPSCRSCLTDVHVEVGGTPLPLLGTRSADPLTLAYGTFPAGALALVVAGCGHPSTRISLDGPAFPHATVTADFASGGAPHVTWATDAGSVGALLTLRGGSHGELCHVEGASEYTFTDWMFGSSIVVEALASRTEAMTEFGAATVWRAGAAGAMFPPQAR